MIVRSAIPIFVAAAVASAAVASCGSGVRASSTTATSPAILTVATSAQTTGPSQAPATVSPTTTSLAVFGFLTAGTADSWRVTNDTVMGGVSKGELSWTEGVLVFTGELSLANNGGFASIRSPQIDPQRAVNWARRTGPNVKVDGDGRTWTVELRTDDNTGGWIKSFPTSPDGLTDVELPWASFRPVTRFLEPRATAEPLDPARIVSLAFYLVDGIEGPFKLIVHSIG